MIPHHGSIQDVCHRLRVATHTASVYLNELGDSETTATEAADIRADLRGYLMTVLAGLDALSPAHAVHDEPDAVNVVRMPVRPAVPPIQAIEEVWR